MMGRAIECCAPIIVSDTFGIWELVELASNYKIPERRVVEPLGEEIVDIGRAWGRDNMFKIVARHLPKGIVGLALDRYRSLA